MVRKPPKSKKWDLNQTLQDMRELVRLSMVLALEDPCTYHPHTPATHKCTFFLLPRTSTTEDIVISCSIVGKRIIPYLLLFLKSGLDKRRRCGTLCSC